MSQDLQNWQVKKGGYSSGNMEFKNSKLYLNEMVKSSYLFSSAFITDGSVKFSPTPLSVDIKKTTCITNRYKHLCLHNKKVESFIASFLITLLNYSK